jgi:hypothetical protein
VKINFISVLFFKMCINILFVKFFYYVKEKKNLYMQCFLFSFFSIYTKLLLLFE